MAGSRPDGRVVGREGPFRILRTKSASSSTAYGIDSCGASTIARGLKRLKALQPAGRVVHVEEVRQRLHPGQSGNGGRAVGVQRHRVPERPFGGRELLGAIRAVQRLEEASARRGDERPIPFCARRTGRARALTSRSSPVAIVDDELPDGSLHVTMTV